MIHAKNLLIITTLLSSFTLFGCGAKEIEIKNIPTQKTKLELKSPSPIDTKPVEWYIITPENYEEIFSKLQKENTSVVLFGLSDVGYENLSLNIAQLKRYIIEQNKIISIYKDYYESWENENDQKNQKN